MMDREIFHQKDAAAQKAADKEPVERKRERETREHARLEATQLAHFSETAAALRAICRDNPGRELQLNKDVFSEEERLALTKVMMAKRGHDTKEVALSALVRMKLLNQALAVLHPTLALGRMYEFDRGLKTYLDVQRRISAVRAEIKSAGGVEAIAFKVAGTEKAEEQQEDEEDENADNDEDKPEEAVEPVKNKKQSRLGRLFRRKKTPNEG